MLQSCLTLCDPRDGSSPGSPVPGILQNTGMGCHFLLQGMKVKSESKAAQPCPTLCDPIDGSPPGSPVPGILQNTGVGCHFPLQCMKVKSESEVAQSYPTLCDPMDCSLLGSSVHGIFRQEYWSGVPLHSPAVFVLVFYKQTILMQDPIICFNVYTRRS